MEFETHQVRETLLRVYTVVTSPDLRPEDSTFLTRTIRPQTIEIVCSRDDSGMWKLDTVAVLGAPVNKNGKLAPVTWTANFWASDFSPKSRRAIPEWFTTWIFEQVSMF